LPGVIFGRFPVYDRLRFNIGVGYQIALSPATNYEPLTPLYKNNFILSARLAF
jgi:hypothetical protein